MAHIDADRVKETTTTIGTGAITLAGAVVGFRSFSSAMSIGDTCSYAVVSATGLEWETGIGTYSGATTLTRTTIKSSANNTSPPTAMVFTAGVKDVFVGPIAGTLVPYNPVTGALNLGVDALNDVAITSPTSGQVIKYSGTAWTNQADAVNVGTVTSVAATAGTGISVTGSPITGSGTLNITNTAPDQTVSLTAGTGISATGTYPNFTVGLGSLTSAQLASALTDETGTGAAVFATSPTLVTPLANALSAVPVTSGAGNSLTLTAGSGVGAFKGGDIILQPGPQGTSGGDGKILIQNVIGQGPATTVICAQNTIAQAVTVANSLANAKHRWDMDRNGVTQSIYMSRGLLVVPSLTNVPTLTIGGMNDNQPESSGYYGEGLGNVIGNGGIGLFASHGPRLWAFQSLVGVTTGLGFSSAGIPATSTDNAISRASVGVLRISSSFFSNGTTSGGGSLSFPSSTTPFPNSQSVSNKAITSNVATLTLPSGHGYIVGANVVVAISDAVFDGTFILTAVAATTISYAKTNANVTSAAASGTVTYSPNDIPLSASAFQRLNCTVASSITGIAPPTGGTHVDGRMIRVYNVGTANLTFVHNSSLSTSSPNGNRFWNVTAADIIIAPNDFADLTYDLTSNGSGSAGWRLA